MEKQFGIEKLTYRSDFQCPIGGSGGIGAPSINKPSSIAGTSGKYFSMIFDVSWALLIVDFTISVYGSASSANLAPVDSA